MRTIFRATDADADDLKICTPEGTEIGDAYEAYTGEDGKNGHLIRFLIEDGKVRCTEWKELPAGGGHRMIMMVMDPCSFDVVSKASGETLATSRRVPGVFENVVSDPVAEEE